MKHVPSRRALAAIAAGLAVAGGGTAIAAGGSSSDSSFLDAVARHLGISSKKLEDATKAAAKEQVDQLLADGRLTKEQADALKQRIDAGGLPFFRGFGPGGGFGHGPGLGRGGHLADAATYLGLTEAKLIEQLQAGTSLADVAKAQGKPVAGLKDALLASEKKELDALVADGRITRAQADDALARKKERLDAIVNGTFGDRDGDGPHLFGDRMGHGFDQGPASYDSGPLGEPA